MSTVRVVKFEYFQKFEIFEAYFSLKTISNIFKILYSPSSRLEDMLLGVWNTHGDKAQGLEVVVSADNA